MTKKRRTLKKGSAKIGFEMRHQDREFFGGSVGQK
jgi:hypothetical protein